MKPNNKYILLALLLSYAFNTFAQNRTDVATRASRDSLKSIDKAEVQEINLQRKKLAKVDLPLQTLETNFLGYTKDSDDGPFMDFTVSEAYHIQAFSKLDSIWSSRHFNLYNFRLYFAFTGRFGQYLTDRNSAPVIGKRFNPVIYIQYHPTGHQLWEGRAGYGHESNGQSIGDSATFYAAVKDAQGKSTNRALFINQELDYISRGWDYVTLEGIRYFEKGGNGSVSTIFDLTLRYYLDYGLLEGYREEYQSWEKDWYGKDLKRNDVSGLEASVDWFPDKIGWSWLYFHDLKADYESGIGQPFRYNSIKLLLGFNLWTLPLCFTYRNGYNGDLAQYGKRNQSIGFALALTTLKKPTSDPVYDLK